VVKDSVDRGEALRWATRSCTPTTPSCSGRIRLGRYQRLWLAGLLVVRTDDKDHIALKPGQHLHGGGVAEAHHRRGRRLPPPRPGPPSSRSRVHHRADQLRRPRPDHAGVHSEAVFRMLVPNAFGDNVKFLSFSELRGSARSRADRPRGQGQAHARDDPRERRT